MKADCFLIIIDFVDKKNEKKKDAEYNVNLADN